MAKGQPGVPGGPGGGNGGGGGGKSDKGDVYGDQYVVLRDLDSSDGGGNGEPVLDANGNLILVGTDGLPIYFEEDLAGPHEVVRDQC